MTRTEFDQWWADVKLRWPSVSTWLAKAFPAEPQQVAFLRTWRDVLADVSLDHCLEINSLMQSGDMQFVGSDGKIYDSDLEKLAQHVRRLAKRLTWERSGRIEQSEPRRFDGSISNSPNLKKILLRWRELQDEGHSREDARAMAMAEFPIGTSPYREPRYNCHLCLDQGCVIVASNAAIEAVLSGTFEQCHHRESAVRCKCRPPLPQNTRWKQATYDAQLCFRVTDSLIHCEKEVAAFIEWVEAQREKRATAMAQANPNYEPAFAAFSQGRAF